MTTQRAPKGLSAGGRALWSAVLAGFELTSAERQILAEACRTVDELDRLKDALAGEDVLALGSRGQPVPHPLLGEIRAHRATLARLIAALGLPDVEESAPPSAASRRASDAASRRWKMEKHRRASRGTAS